MDIQSVGIVGAGQMGSGIAHVFALAGFDVLMTDISEDSLAKALSQIDRNIERQVSRGKVSVEAKAAAMAPAGRRACDPTAGLESAPVTEDARWPPPPKT